MQPKRMAQKASNSNKSEKAVQLNPVLLFF
jgi:hypothetical protein